MRTLLKFLFTAVLLALAVAGLLMVGGCTSCKCPPSVGEVFGILSMP